MSNFYLPNNDLTNVYFDDLTQEEIFSIFRVISEATGARYMSYLYENFDKKYRYAFTTNPDWQKVYVTEQRINNCHMWLNVTEAFLTTNKKSYILLWDSIKPETRKQRNIYFERTDHEIGINGISFCSSFGSSREIIGFSPDLKTPNFQYYVSKNIDLIRNAVYQIRKKLSTSVLITKENKKLNEET